VYNSQQKFKISVSYRNMLTNSK